MKSAIPRRVPSMFSSPCVARSPVSGSIEPTLISPDRAGAPSVIIAGSSIGAAASSSIELTAAVTPTATATAMPMPIIASCLPFNARPADGGFKKIVAAAARLWRIFVEGIDSERPRMVKIFYMAQICADPCQILRPGVRRAPDRNL